ncbi:hypothetical protein ACFL0M_15120 [Thermodesulfobacteriota bacterium]
MAEAPPKNIAPNIDYSYQGIGPYRSNTDRYPLETISAGVACGCAAGNSDGKKSALS